MNHMAGLFEDRGFESYVVPADGSGPATFVERPAKVLSVDAYRATLGPDDISIDFWPDQKLVDIAAEKRNAHRIFWQHGASIPVGGVTAGESVFLPGNPYTQHWNVSRACADYLESRYSITMPVVHPFFDTDLLASFQQASKPQRSGFLVLSRRGARHIRPIIQLLGDEQVTILREPFHERDWFNALSEHQYFISIDDGIRSPTLIRRAKNQIRALMYPEVRARRARKHGWLIPDGNLLGFPMPPTEAALLGCRVIGFTMGGGREWMRDDNCLLADDADQASLLEQVKRAQTLSDEQWDQRTQRALDAASQFTQEHTWNHLTALLPL